MYSVTSIVDTVKVMSSSTVTASLGQNIVPGYNEEEITGSSSSGSNVLKTDLTQFSKEVTPCILL